MGADRQLDLVCVSYLADAQVLHVNTYPRANGGTVVDAVAASIAADGPLTAMTAAGLGLRTGLISNGVGADPAGRRLTDWLEHAGVRHVVHHGLAGITPQLTVIDDASTRTWFAALEHAYDDLRRADLGLLHRARLVYVDCYTVITAAATRAIAAAGDTPLLLNLGSDPLDDSVVAAARRRRLRAVQTGLDEADASRAERLATDLFHRLRPDAAVVTLGSLGALAVTRDGVHRVAAPAATVTHTHGAGAAFSAGYAHALLGGADISTALSTGCAAGTAHCTSPAAPIPRRAPIRSAA